METKETSAKCCMGIGSKHKRVFIIISGIILLAIIALSIASIGWRIHEAKNRGNSMMYGYGNVQQGFGGMMNRGKYKYQVPGVNDKNQFILPEDALKSGELAVVVGDLEVAKKTVLDIAEKSKGSVYKTYISYASNDLKNGSIVVQVPAENFDSAFDGLKKVGSQVIQESTEQVAPRNFYPVPMATTEKADPAQDLPTENISNTDESATSSSDAKPEIAIYPAPNPIKVSQDKGYVKIIFVDYGVTAKADREIKKQDYIGNVISIGDPANQNVRNNMIVILGIKLIALIAILGLLVVVFKKIFNRIRTRKEDKKRVHIVRMMPKTRARVVRIQKRK